MSNSAKPTSNKRKPLTVWELPKLLQSVHDHRKSKMKGAKERPHYPAILAFVYRNRFAIGPQIQRRFSEYLRSDRTARRHLAELESLGFLDTVQPPSPLWPKTYYCTARGVRRLRSIYAEKGKNWSPTIIDRYRKSGFSPAHVCHEIAITEVGLLAWEAARASEDLEILATERRSLARHPSFKISVAGKWGRLIPDGLFLFHQQRKGMMTTFLEIDLDNMSERQWVTKLRRYESWAQSEAGNRWLLDVYCSHGAESPRPVFRILTVADSERRKEELADWSLERCQQLHRRLWFVSVQDLNGFKPNVFPVAIPDGQHIIV